MFSNGKTAIEAFSDDGADGAHHLQAAKPASSASKTAIVEAARNPTDVLREAGLRGSRAWRDLELSRSVGLAEDQVL